MRLVAASCSVLGLADCAEQQLEELQVPKEGEGSHEWAKLAVCSSALNQKITEGQSEERRIRQHRS